ncbi:hypothetical protein OS493_037532 [Desmophyllum pertusum]|uniref:Uncharacterized protein n=1 Tax=Desmophyllum pertusum TaxID=174260 RepID=A0A9W9ZL85_9CNID|nr:hypothetical protein OS493_037532 [Desmophyllum pertusum]
MSRWMQQKPRLNQLNKVKRVALLRLEETIDDVNDADRGETAAETKRELEEKNNSVLAVGISLSLVVGIGLVCILILRRSGSLWLKRPKSAQEAAYEEPVESTAARIMDSPTFHNEFYDADCVLSIGEKTASTRRLSRLGPLPPLPADIEEGIYEVPVVTRNVAYHGLVKETKESKEPITDEPKSEKEFHPPPVYNTLEPPPDDNEDDYDDNIESRSSEA